jgi:hypothetical protein
MNLERFISTVAKLILGAVAIGGMLASGTQTATAQAITVTTPFAFTAGNQSYPAGTYEFIRQSEWFLTIRNVNGGAAKFFAIRPEAKIPLRSQAGLIFNNSEGHRNLQAVYVPGTDSAAELPQHQVRSQKTKSDLSSASTVSSEKVTVTKQNAMGR